jgi:peptidoglycan/LPS O-acetylase OafA/YrhL
VLIAAFLVDLGLGSDSPIVGSGDYAFGLWVYMTNVYLAKAGWEVYGWFAHFWSLAIEEHFYLIWPALVFVLSRRMLVSAAVVAIVGAFGFRLLAHGADVWPPAVYFLTPFRIDGLAMGTLLALLARGDTGLRPLVPTAAVVGGIAAIGVLIIAVSAGQYDYENPFVYTAGFTLTSIACAAILVSGVVDNSKGRLKHLLAHRSLRFFGKYSYGLYVLHPPIFMALFHTDDGRTLLKVAGLWSPIGAAFVAMILIVTAALISWHCWEKPFLRLKRHFEPGSRANRIPTSRSVAAAES